MLRQVSANAALRLRLLPTVQQTVVQGALIGLRADALCLRTAGSWGNGCSKPQTRNSVGCHVRSPKLHYLRWTLIQCKYLMELDAMAHVEYAIVYFAVPLVHEVSVVSALPHEIFVKGLRCLWSAVNPQVTHVS